jgi:hypothetical protein
MGCVATRKQVDFRRLLAAEIAEEPDYTITIGPLGAERGSVIQWVNVDSDASHKQRVDKEKS